jgi:hypothetical protein
MAEIRIRPAVSEHFAREDEENDWHCDVDGNVDEDGELEEDGGGGDEEGYEELDG